MTIDQHPLRLACFRLVGEVPMDPFLLSIEEAETIIKACAPGRAKQSLLEDLTLYIWRTWPTTTAPCLN